MIKRKAIPLGVKVEACIRALGLDPAKVDWHHTPPLQLRPLNGAGTDYDPPQLDPRHIVPLARADHQRVTTDRRGESKLSVTGNGDVSRIAKVKRIRGETKRKAKRTWPKGRPIKSRNTLRRQA